MTSLHNGLTNIKHVLFSKQLSKKRFTVLVLGVFSVLLSGILPFSAFLYGSLPFDVARYVGSFMFYAGLASCLYVGLTSKFKANWQIKRQVVTLAAFTFILLSVFAVIEAPAVNALTPLPSDKGPNNSSAYKFSVPFTEYQWIIAQFRDGTYYAINGSDWNIMTIVEPWQAVAPWAALATNKTALEAQVLSSTTAGKILLNEVTHNYSLTVPANVTIVESVNGLTRQFINSANTQGSPYVISVDTVQSGYYLAQDKASRYINSYSSTDCSTVINRVGAIPNTEIYVNIAQQTPLNSGINITANGVSVTAMGREVTTFSANTNLNYLFTAGTNSTPVNGLTLKNIGFNMNTSITSVNSAVYLIGGNIIIDSVSVYNPTWTLGTNGRAIHVLGGNSSNVTIKNCNLTNIYDYGLYLDGGISYSNVFSLSHVTVTNNIINHTFYNAIACYGVDYAIISGNQIDYSGHGAITLSPARHVSIFGNVLTNAGNYTGDLSTDGFEGGIEIEQAHHYNALNNETYDVTVSDNIVESCNSGIVIRGGSNSLVSDFSITGNTITNSVYQGILSRYAKAGQITGNTVVNTTKVNTVYTGWGWGIWLEYSQSISLSSNTVWRCSKYGIDLDATSRNLTAYGNTVYDIGLTGSGGQVAIAVAGPFNIINGNNVYDTQGASATTKYGIYIYATTGLNNTIINNQVANCMSSGAAYTDLGNGTIYHNNVIDGVWVP